MKKPLDEAETQLLQQINAGLSDAEWRRYYELIEKRRAERLSADEHAELSATSNRIEEANARRIACLAKLAEIRTVSLPKLMDDLGISPPAVI
jgi:hypothetical protein